MVQKIHPAPASIDDTLKLLAGANLIYLLRARTEERHLSQDPVYRDYAAFIDQHGLIAVLRRALRGIARRVSPAASARAPTA